MTSLQELDRLLSDIAALVYRTVPVPDWQQAILHAKYTPDGSVSGHDFDYVLADGRVDRGSSPSLPEVRQIREITRQHWTQSQPRWYAMHLTVSKDGKVHADWEYKEDYQVGDIIQRA